MTEHTWIPEPDGTYLISSHDGEEAMRPVFDKDDISYTLHGYMISAEQAAYLPGRVGWIKMDCSGPVAITSDVTAELFVRKAQDADLCIWKVNPS